jgi:WD40 repeat protein
LVRDAARVTKSDLLQAQAAAILAEEDARPRKAIDDIGGYHIAFEPAGTRLLIAATNRKSPFEPIGVRIWNSQSDQIEMLAGSEWGPVAFRPNGTPVQLCIALKKGEAGEIVLRELTGRRSAVPLSLPGRIDEESMQESTVSPDLKRAAVPFLSGEGKPVLGVWDAETGQLRHRFEGPCSAVAFSSDGRLLARGNPDGLITVWSLPDGKQVASLGAGRNAIQALVFARDRLRRSDETARNEGQGWLLGAGDRGGLLTVHDLGARVVRCYCLAGGHGVTAVAFSPDGQTVASGGRGVRLWDLATGRSILRLGITDMIRGMSFSPDGRHLAFASLGVFDGPTIQVWEIEPHRGIQALRGLGTQISKMCLSPDGRLIAALAHDWQVAVWERSTGALVHIFQAPRGLVSDNAALAFDRDGRRLAFATSGRAVLWDRDSGSTLRTWDLPDSLQDTLAFHPSGKLILGRLETKDGLRGPYSNAPPRDYPRVYRVRDLLGPDPVKPILELDEFNWHVFDSAAAPDGRYFVVDGKGGPDGEKRIVKVFEPLTGKMLYERAPEFRGRYGCIRLDPTGRVMWLEDPDGRFSLVELPSGRFLRSMKIGGYMAPDARVQAISVDAAGKVGLKHGLALENERGRHLVVLGVDAEGSGIPVFDASGRAFAWGSVEGTVYVADLVQVQARLAAVGLGW